MTIHVLVYTVIQGVRVRTGNSRVGHGHDDPAGTKTLTYEYSEPVWRLAVGETAPLQQASGSLHEEAWVGRVNSSNLRISQDVEIGPGVS